MRAAQFVGTGQPPQLKDLPKPEPLEPQDVVVRISGAGVCRTDIHILDGAAPLQPAPLPPYTLGHENAGWIEAVGPAVRGITPGAPVILHPAAGCGLCAACRRGADMYCPNLRFPGVDGSNGGYAEFLQTSIRSIVPLAVGTDPTDVAPLADAGVTAYHAVDRIRQGLGPESCVAVIGVGGLGHIGVQLLRALTPAAVVAVDVQEDRLDLARRLGAEQAFSARDPGVVAAVRDFSGGEGVDVVLDFVGEGDTPALARRLVRRGGTYSIVGYGGSLTIPTVDMITQELRILGNFVGTYRDLSELMELNRRGLVRVEAKRYPLERAGQAIEDLRAGSVLGRAVLVP